MNSEKHLPQSPYKGQCFQMTTFCIAFYESYLSTVHCLGWYYSEWRRILFTVSAVCQRNMGMRDGERDGERDEERDRERDGEVDGERD